jgi:hypothetical protein
MGDGHPMDSSVLPGLGLHFSELQYFMVELGLAAVEWAICKFYLLGLQQFTFMVDPQALLGTILDTYTLNTVKT